MKTVNVHFFKLDREYGSFVTKINLIIVQHHTRIEEMERVETRITTTYELRFYRTQLLMTSDSGPMPINNKIRIIQCDSRLRF